MSETETETETDLYGPDSDETVSVSAFELDHYCWALVETIDHFYPPDETAEACLEPVPDVDDAKEWRERGYHIGALAMTEDAVQNLRVWLEVDVLARAERYRQRKDLPEFGFPATYLEHGNYYLFGRDAVEMYLTGRQERKKGER